MKVVVQNEGVWKDSISGQGQNRRVTLKPVEPHSKRYVYLNVTDYENTNGIPLTEHWKNAKTGYMLNVSLLNDTTVNKFAPYTILKKPQEESNESIN